MAAQRKQNKAQEYRTVVASAMPDVKALVKKYGRKAVANCVAKIRDYDKEVARLAELKKDIAAREAKLR